MTYGPTGLLLSKTIDPVAPGSPALTSVYTYDAHDRLATVTDPRGRVTSHLYNERGLLTQVTQPDGSSIVMGYDAYGNKTSQSNELGHTWSWTYNVWRQMLTAVDPLNRSTSYEYGLPANCGCGNVGVVGDKPAKITLPSGKVTEFYYDKEWNLISRIEGAGTVDEAVTLYAYDAEQNLTQTTDPLGQKWKTTYDSRNRVLTTVNPKLETVNFSYDAAGNVLSVTDALGRVTTNSYDAMNRLLSSLNANGENTQFSYDEGDNLLSMTDAKGNTYTFEYDLLKRKTKMIYPGGGSQEQWSYDDTAPAGNIWTVYTARDGSTMSCTYDNRGRETFCDFSDPNTPDVTKTYDVAGRTLSVSSSTASYAYTYDNANQLLSENTSYPSVSTVFSVVYTYDADGNRQSLTYPSGKVVEYAYTNRNQLKRIESDFKSGQFVAYTYDKNGNRTGKNLDNNSSTVYAYDIVSRLTSITDSNLNGVFNTLAYTLNAVGNRTAKTQNTVAETYAYDAIDQVTGVSKPGNTQSFAYDAVGNRTSVTATAPSLAWVPTQPTLSINTLRLALKYSCMIRKGI
ncbi:MAG: RHS repeat protein [Blastochloris sp.]|nr:RHS repeat protein [Blastochloris sp.]